MRGDFIKILIDFKSIPKHKSVKTFMEISGYPHYENVCSNILKFYLDPAQEHGLKDLILKSLVKLVDKEFAFDTYFEKIEIHREFITSGGNRLDLMLLTQKYVIGIENKIHHSLHNDLVDYHNTVLSKCSSSRKPICIVLTLNKLTSPHDIEKMATVVPFFNVTYGQLFKNIRLCIGDYVNTTNTVYVNHLFDFIKSIENLSPKTMENKVLWRFFKDNSDAVEELMDSFEKYKEYLNRKVTLLSEALPVSEVAPRAKEKWLYGPNCLVFDFVIESKHELSVDIYLHPKGWEVQVFGRNKSNNIVLNDICRRVGFLPMPYESYEVGDRLIYSRFDTEKDISEIAEVVADLLSRIESLYTTYTV